MVSVVRSTVNNFREQFLVMHYLESSPALVLQQRKKAARSVSQRPQLSRVADVYQQSFFLSRSPFYSSFTPTLYAHMEARFITSVN